jgi:two-component system, LytTR family, sensor kinase
VKHPVLANKERLVIWWLVWLLLGLGQSLSYYFAYGYFAGLSVTDGILSILIYSGIALSLWYPFSFFIRSKTSNYSLISNLVISGAVTVIIWLFITKNAVQLILPSRYNYSEFWEATFPFRIGSGFFIYGLIILSYFLFISLTNLSEKNAKEARLETLVKEIELKMLRSQINPHFLFNTLNSVSSLTITDPEKARMMVIKLSDFMRYALTSKDDRPVELRSELENLRLYLDIEKVRFGDKLIYEEVIDEECLKQKIPVMLLQPLFENAVKHGVYESTNPVKLVMNALYKDEYLEITISNNYETEITSASGTGSGLQNVSRRLELFYEGKAFIKTTRDKGIHTVRLFIPADHSK